jgi:NADPH2:quinone reductase
MLAWRVHDFGEPRDVFVLDDIEPPEPSDLAGLGMDLSGWVPLAPGAAPFTDWVILDVSTAALALPDVTMARGTYPVPVRRPYVSGQEAVGVVTAAAPGREHLVGRRIVTVTIQPFGGLAPVAVGVSQLFEVPEHLSDDEAAGFLIAAHTAYHATIRRGAVREGETVAVLGAAGGVGSAAVQLCAAAGADVIAIVGSEDKAAFCLGLGARAAVDHSAAVDGDFRDLVRLASGGRGVDVVIDPVQGEMGALAQQLLVPDGRHVLCGHAGGLQPIDPHFYMYNRTLVGATLGSYPRQVMRRIHEETHAALVGLLESGRFRPQVTQSVPFSDVPQALSDLAARKTMGRVVVRVRPESRTAV